MRIVHVVPSVAEEASGPSYCVLRLCESLIEVGADARVAALDWCPDSPSTAYLKTFSLASGPRGLGRSPEMYRWLEEQAASERLDLIHNHGLWMMPNIYPGRVCRRHSHCQLMVSPHGTLAEWALAFHPLRKRAFWRLLQAQALRPTVCFHATSEAEYQDIRRADLKQPVCILPNGVDVPPLKKDAVACRRQLLFLGRIHPKKGLPLLLRAWKAIQDRFRDWELHVVGPDGNGHLAEMQFLASSLRLERAFFRGPVYGAQKLDAYRRADLFVLPTHSENFGLSVAEALAAGTPALVTVGAPWFRLPGQGAGWSIEIGVDPMVACLEEALGSPPEQLAQMGRAGRRWMAREFAWHRIGEQFAVTYQWLLEGGDTPAWVRMN